MFQKSSSSWGSKVGFKGSLGSVLAAVVKQLAAPQQARRCACDGKGGSAGGGPQTPAPRPPPARVAPNDRAPRAPAHLDHAPHRRARLLALLRPRGGERLVGVRGEGDAVRVKARVAPPFGGWCFGGPDWSGGRAAARFWIEVPATMKAPGNTNTEPCAKPQETTATLSQSAPPPTPAGPPQHKPALSSTPRPPQPHPSPTSPRTRGTSHPPAPPRRGSTPGCTRPPWPRRPPPGRRRAERGGRPGRRCTPGTRAASLGAVWCGDGGRG